MMISNESIQPSDISAQEREITRAEIEFGIYIENEYCIYFSIYPWSLQCQSRVNRERERERE